MLKKTQDYHPSFLIPVIILTITSLPYFVNSQTYNFDHLGLNDGLSQITVNTIFQDSYGYLWFGTQDGLNQYDGYQFKTYKSEPNNENSLSHNWIWDIFEDSNKNLWVSTWSGLNKINPDKSRITKYYTKANRRGSIRGDRPVSVQESSDGKIWIGTWGGGLNVYNPESDSFLCYSNAIQKTGDLPGDFIRKIYLDTQNNLWIGTWAGLWKARITDSEKIEFNYIDIRPGIPRENIKITTITEDQGGNIWFGSLGLGVFRHSANKENIKNYTRDNSALISDQISSIIKDASGNLWIGTVSNGISLLNLQNNQFSFINHDSENPGSLQGNNINSMFMDKSGLIWIGAKGISIFNSSQNKFNFHYDFTSVGREFNSISDVSALAQDSTGRIWVGTDGKGLFCLRKGDSNSNDTWIKEVLDSLKRLNIGAISIDNNNNLWIGSRGNGLIKLSLNQRKITNILSHDKNPDSYGLNFINGLVFIPPSSIWIATYDQGLIEYDIQKRKYEKLYHQQDNSTSFPANYLLRIYRDQMNKLWICTWGAGIIYFNPLNDTWRTFSNIPDDPTSLSDNISHSFCESFSGNKRHVWIGTRKGLSELIISDSIENKFINYYPSDGLAGNIINSILEDENDKLWISSNSGLTRFDLTSHRTRNFDIHDGLQGNEFNAGAGLKLDDGRLAFGGVNGLNIFFPDSISERNYNPDIVINSFKVFTEEIPLNPERETYYLDHQDNFLSFEFSSLDYSQPLKNQYKYQMLGIDRDWIYAEKRRFANYTDLSPGSYTFKVMGSNSDGLWSNKIAKLNIVITPPYWQTWWFRVTIGLLLVGLIYFFLNNRLQKIRDIEKLRVRIASDLHDDIGSSLTRITIHSQLLQNGKDKNKATASIEKIGELSREIISTMSDIVWSIDARNDGLSDMLDRVRDFAYDTLSEKDISVIFREEGMTKHKKIDVLFRQNIFSIFKESVNNIVKHSEADKVEIILINTHKEFSMKISDNGKGFDEEKIKKGNGLQNMKMRAKRIGATLEIEDSKGTIILLQSKNL